MPNAFPRAAGPPFVHTRPNRQNSLLAVMVALVLLAFAWRVFGLNSESLWRDEIDAVFFALRDLPQALSMFVDPAQNGALFFLGLRPWLRLLGTSEFALRYPAVLFGTLAVPLTWRVAMKLVPKADRASYAANTPLGLAGQLGRWISKLSDQPALLAAVLLAVNPYHLWYSQDGKMYALVTLLALLASFFWLQGIDKGGWRPWLAFLVVMSLAIHVHLLMVLMIPLFAIWFVLAWPAGSRRWRAFGLALAGLTLPYLPFIRWQWVLLTAPSRLTAIDFVPLGDMVSRLLLEQIWSILPQPGRLVLTPFVALFAGALMLGFVATGSSSRGALRLLPRLRRHLMLASWSVFPVLSIYLLSLRQPVFIARYLIWTLPANAILLALGVRFLRREGGRLGRPLAMILALYLVAIWIFAGWRQHTQETKPDLRGAVEYVHTRRRPEELLILQIPRAQLAYRYYSSDQGSDPFAGGDDRLGLWAPGPVPGPNSDANAVTWVGQELRRSTASVTDVWVLFTEAETVDPERLTAQWLSRNLTQVETIDLYQVQVGHYRK